MNRLNGYDPCALSTREREVLRLIGQGMSNAEISDALDITYNTVRCYTKRLHDKLFIEGRARLAIYASRLNDNGGHDGRAEALPVQAI